MAYQFVHIEIYSRKGRVGRGVDFVLAEAARRPDSCPHVAAPLPPEVVYGGSLDDVRRIHDERLAAATTTTKNGKSRRIRSDQNTLVTVVASHPATTDAVRDDPAVAAAVREWEQRTVEWLQGQYGSQLVSVIRHVDEVHAHLHAFIVPRDAEVRASNLHPGQEAKAKVVAAGKADGEDGKTVNRRGDQAYKAALREWQDAYWKQVGLPCGLTRMGPGRRRLTRAEWQSEKKQAQAAKITQQRVEALRRHGSNFIERTRATAEATLEEALTTAERIHVEAAAQQKASALAMAEAAAREGKARKALARAQRESSRLIIEARTEADRLRSWGQRIRGFWDGLRQSRLAQSIREAVSEELEKARNEAEAARERAKDEAKRRRDAELGREAAIAAAQALGQERDHARRQLAATRGQHDPNLTSVKGCR